MMAAGPFNHWAVAWSIFRKIAVSLIERRASQIAKLAL